MQVFKSEYCLDSNLYLSFREEPGSNFEDDILVLLEGTNGALEHRALPGLAVLQLTLELRQRTLTPKFKKALTILDYTIFIELISII